MNVYSVSSLISQSNEEKPWISISLLGNWKTKPSRVRAVRGDEGIRRRRKVQRKTSDVMLLTSVARGQVTLFTRVDEVWSPAEFMKDRGALGCRVNSLNVWHPCYARNDGDSPDPLIGGHWPIESWWCWRWRAYITWWNWSCRLGLSVMKINETSKQRLKQWNMGLISQRASGNLDNMKWV
jgi:hypothetical protein